MQTTPRRTVPLRITVVHPPPGVRFAIQSGKAELIESSCIAVSIEGRSRDGGPNGATVQFLDNGRQVTSRNSANAD